MNPADHSTAWEHSPTRRAWWKQFLLCAIAPVVWIALWFASLAVLVVFMPAGYGSSILFAPLIIYTFYRAYIQLFYIPIVLRKRRALQEYPWRLFKNAPHGLTKRDEVLGKQLGWFEFPNPTRPEEQLPMVFPTHWAVGWWHRRMAPRAKPHIKAQIDVVWMAGDPRIVAVIAASTSDGTMPRRFRFVTQQTGTAEGLRPATDWGATPEDIERARRVGIMPSNR